MSRHYRCVSAGGHFESPPEQWTHRVPKQYRDRAPRRIKLANGGDGLLIEGRPLLYGGTSQGALDSLTHPNAKTTKPQALIDTSILEEIRKAGFVDSLYGRPPRNER